MASSDGTLNSFVTGSISIASTTLWIDKGATLYASRNPKFYQSTGNCGLTGVSDSNACLPLLAISGTSPGLVGDGIVDGQGGEPLINQGYSWWDLSNALRASNGSGPNPALVEVKKATGFVMYRIALHNSPKFHVKLQAYSPSTTLDEMGFPTCTTPGAGFIVWGIEILTPAVSKTSTGFRPNPYYTRNTDGVDPGEFGQTNCGVIACSNISTGDDMVALKAAHGLRDIVVAHNHFGTGHGMSLGSETNGGATNVDVHDLTIDGDSRWNGAPASDTGDFNGVRVKSDESRGGLVDNIHFSDVCIRDVLNPIVIDSSYNPLYGGNVTPDGGRGWRLDDPDFQADQSHERRKRDVHGARPRVGRHAGLQRHVLGGPDHVGQRHRRRHHPARRRGAGSLLHPRSGERQLHAADGERGDGHRTSSAASRRPMRLYVPSAPRPEMTPVARRSLAGSFEGA